jgi:type IV secretory pathway VirB10-like protein
MPASARFSRRGRILVLATALGITALFAYALLVAPNNHPTSTNASARNAQPQLPPLSDWHIRGLDTIPTNPPASPPTGGAQRSSGTKTTRTTGTSPTPRASADLGDVLDTATRATQTQIFDVSPAHAATFGPVALGPTTPNIGTSASISPARAATATKERTLQAAITSPLKIGGGEEPLLAPRPQPAVSATPTSAPSGGPLSAQVFASSSEGRNEYLDEKPQAQAGRYELWSGTVIRAVLDSAIDADLPGPVFAHVAQDIYDSRTGSTLLIPKGSLLRGRYNTNVTVGQHRVQVVWETLRWPNGEWLRLDAMPSADLAGEAGLAANVNDHRGRIITTTLLTAVLAAAPALAGSQTVRVDANGNVLPPTIGQTLGQSAAAQIGQTGGQMVQQSMQQPPTLTVPRGTPFDVMVDRSITLEPYTP